MFFIPIHTIIQLYTQKRTKGVTDVFLEDNYGKTTTEVEEFLD